MTPIPLVSFAIDRSREMSLQKQIQSNIVAGIQSGKFRPGAPMPSSRALAKFLGVSRLTVTLAYSEMVANDYLTTKDRAGYFISDNIADAPKQPARTPPPQNDASFIPDFVRQYSDNSQNIARPDNWRNYPYRFIFGQADPSILDHQHWRQCSLEALGRRDFNTLILDSYERDDPLLTEYLLNVTLPRRGIYAEPDELLITVGAQNALWLSAQLLLDHRKTAVIENPCYPGLRNILANHGSLLHPLDVDDEGLPVQHIPQSADVVFVSPGLQSPTNAYMPEHRRTALLQAAAQHDFAIVEDDYEQEIGHLYNPKPALKARDKNGHVIYIGSFSKSLFPGLRLGYMVANKYIIDEARSLRGAMLRHPPTYSQRTVAYFQSLGYFDSLLNRISKHFKDRHQRMQKAIDEYGLDYAGPPDARGYSFWMRTDPRIDSSLLAQNLRQQGVLIEPGTPFFNPAAPARHYYRLAYSSIEARKIPEGIRLIREAIDAML